MRLHIETGAAAGIAVDVLAYIGFESGAQASTPGWVNQDGWLEDMRAGGEFTGKLYELALLHKPRDVAAKRLALIGGGNPAKFTPVEARRAAGVLVRTLRAKGFRSIALALDEATPEIISAVAEGAVIGEWEPDLYKTDPQKGAKRLDTFAVLTGLEGAQEALDRGRIIAEGQNLARNLVHEPANKLSPEKLAQAAAAMAQRHGLEHEILDQPQMEELGMGSLLGVAQGSENPPFLLVLKYRPSQTAGAGHLALVGKGVTFDTGGNSIKSSEGMERMKYDMAGAAAVIGAMDAIAQLKPAIPVTGYIPAVENMVSGRAMRPGDILTALSGKTIEVLNTDAEGRLILADALTYANRNGATHIVDAATLTGAIGIALGHYNIGAFTNDDGFLASFLAASRKAGEKAWQLPMDEEYKEYLKSAFADLPNIGGRYGGSITAAWFLREFADPTPWVHLDIASTAWLDDGKAWMSKGPSGVAVRSFVQLALDWNTA